MLPNTAKKFALEVDLGIMTVPDEYDHATALAWLAGLHCKKLYYYDQEITDKDFPTPTRILQPGDQLRVRLFHQIAAGATYLEERMNLLLEENVVFTGVQGGILTWMLFRRRLPEKRSIASYASYQDEASLWADGDSNQNPMVPMIRPRGDGCINLELRPALCIWDGLEDFFCFNEVT